MSLVKGVSGSGCELPRANYCVNFRIASITVTCPYCGYEDDIEPFMIDNIEADYTNPLQYDKITSKVFCQGCGKYFRLGIQQGAKII